MEHLWNLFHQIYDVESLGRIVPNIQERIHLVIAIVIVLSLLPGIAKISREKWKARSIAG